MKKLISLFIFMFIICLSTNIFAEDWADGGCFEFKLFGKPGDEILVINTAKQLTNEKETIIRSKKELNKNANDLGKTIHAKLMKVPDVAEVNLSTRQIAIQKYPYPKKHNWEYLKPLVIKTIHDTLCK